ncbi:uncharacterized protein LOC114332178 [Diabrotica virgifera virgifera]|uniref:Tumor protein p53-inducible protein 13 n=1 Tax=Diabrotica virgifera virgifera TaxID=50390 RepID=A0ABM5JV29_DIAVI|nr:uncharacterized protein LOC114332178 [Diabrotica virgifera virgifera]
MLKNIIVLCLAFFHSSGMKYNENTNRWEGNWFPHSPNELDQNPVVQLKGSNNVDNKHGVIMGIRNPECDDAKTNLTLDWDMNPTNYTCFGGKDLYEPNSYIHPVHSYEYIPASYNAQHKCMDESIEYSEIVPTFGTHRPLWPKYGEYKFVPRQRWIHNLEHGAVVMLYHPCANKNEVNLLKEIVRGCLFKHVITPYNLLSPNRPLALLTWGHRLEMSKISKSLVVRFIRDHAHRGPEDTFKDGQYDFYLTRPAKIVSGFKDSNLCPTERDIMK